MNTVLFYFSGTGNTAWAAKRLAEKLRAAGVGCELRNIENCEIGVRPDDTLIFAFPVYAANIPSVMRDFIICLARSLPPDAATKYAVFTTAGFADGCGPHQVGKLLKKAKLTAYVGLQIASNTPTDKPVGKAELEARLTKADAKLTAFAGSLAAGRRSVAFGPYRFMFMRKATAKALDTAYTKLSVDTDRCLSCMCCIDNCPTNSISRDGEGKMTFTPSCTGCMRCYNNCPAYAIMHDGKYLPPEQFPRYALKEPPDTKL